MVPPHPESIFMTIGGQDKMNTLIEILAGKIEEVDDKELVGEMGN